MVTKLVTILYSIYLMLWMTSFIDSGRIESDERVKTLYSEVLTGAMIGTLFALPVIGKIADSAPISIFLPVAFLFRGFIAFQFKNISDPESTSSILFVYAYHYCISRPVYKRRGTLPPKSAE